MKHFVLGTAGHVDHGKTALIKALKDNNWLVQAYAAQSLGRLGDKQAISALTELLKDENADVRKAAKQAIEKIEGNETITRSFLKAV